MAETQGITVRPDIDIAEDIEDRVEHYPPTMRDRHHFHVSVHEGMVTLKGYVTSPISRRWLLDMIPQIEGVRGLDADELYDDETIRIEVGRALEPGTMFARVEYGAVILTGRVPHGKKAQDYVKKASKIPGVRQVINAFRNA